MNKGLLDEVNIVRDELIHLQCPLVHAGEDTSSVAELLLHDTSHRRDLVKWLGEELLGSGCQNLSDVQILSMLGILSLSDQNHSDLLQTWRLLLRLLLAKSKADVVSDVLQDERHYLSFMQQNVFSSQADMSSSGQRVLSVPRDLKKDFQLRPGAVIPSLETLEKIKEGLDLEAASLSCSTTSEDLSDSNTDTSLKSLYESFSAKLLTFDQFYQRELKSLIETIGESSSQKQDSDLLSHSVANLHKSVYSMNEKNKNQAELRQWYNKMLSESKMLDKLIEENEKVLDKLSK